MPTDLLVQSGGGAVVVWGGVTGSLLPGAPFPVRVSLPCGSGKAGAMQDKQPLSGKRSGDLPSPFSPFSLLSLLPHLFLLLPILETSVASLASIAGVSFTSSILSRARLALIVDDPSSMDDFAPPSGPPPPKAPAVPEGWIARWNDQYKEWFYVNIHTKQSQWDKPTAPAYPAGEGPPYGAPPGYAPGNSPAPSDVKKNPYDDHSTDRFGGSSHTEDEDAKLAARLQAEEDARARGGHGGPPIPPGYGSSSPAQGYSSNSPAQGSYPSELPPRDRGKSGGGFLGKLLGKGKQMAASQGGSHGGGQYGGQYGGQQQYYQQQSHGYPGQGPPMGYGGQPHYGQPQYGQPQYGQQQYGGGYGGYGQGGGQYPQRKQGGGGMGMAGGAALGLGAGVLGGVLVADAINDNEQESYQEGYDDGGGGDDGGGDFGGDF
ncbi:hypothetical protein AK830_g12094 [Neonectria ditissima]|uniref:WW domain-containing protein n=1 Tax=Neonectria ditissima TaxID=78410 RepID=A0A0P7AKR9_9HYPO|nr:hypothetical protein AK830_g12094 [Neonectria ditissima]